MSLVEQIKSISQQEGCAAWGIADLTDLGDDGASAFENVDGVYSRAVVMGLRLQDVVVDEVVDQPTTLYYHNYRQTNYQLDRLAWAVADVLQDTGAAALAVPASQIIKRDPMRGHISHRRLAVLAGIGFIGRSNLLVHPEYGARMRYVSVLTDAELPADKPYDGDECGSCRACIEVCPAQAIGEQSADYNLDACYAKLTEFTRIAFIGQHICGVCVKACSGEVRKNG